MVTGPAGGCPHEGNHERVEAPRAARSLGREQCGDEEESLRKLDNSSLPVIVDAAHDQASSGQGFHALWVETEVAVVALCCQGAASAVARYML
jgi:hypothetical protein